LRCNRTRTLKCWKTRSSGRVVRKHGPKRSEPKAANHTGPLHEHACRCSNSTYAHRLTSANAFADVCAHASAYVRTSINSSRLSCEACDHVGFPEKCRLTAFCAVLALHAHHRPCDWKPQTQKCKKQLFQFAKNTANLLHGALIPRRHANAQRQRPTRCRRTRLFEPTSAAQVQWATHRRCRSTPATRSACTADGVICQDPWDAAQYGRSPDYRLSPRGIFPRAWLQ
jgi:hypothetical protein